MPNRVIEVLAQGAFLSKERGFMLLKRVDEGAVKLPLDDIFTLMLGKGVHISTDLILALHERGSTVVICGVNYHPSSLIWPMSEHTFHVNRLNMQITCSKPLQKRLWQTVVQEKILKQAITLEALTGGNNGLKAVSKRVKSGDPENLEAQAARRYWQNLFGKTFRRKSQSEENDDVNIMLNYGYAVMRAGMARAISGAGLHPALGIYHSNQQNTFALVDDLMEPYRPLVDWKVAQLVKQNNAVKLDPPTKKQLVGLLECSVKNTNGQFSPVSQTMNYVAQSFYKSMEAGNALIEYPDFMLARQLEFTSEPL